jgi:hypothetical protein
VIFGKKCYKASKFFTKIFSGVGNVSQKFLGFWASFDFQNAEYQKSKFDVSEVYRAQKLR